MPSEVRWLSMMARTCLRFLFFSSVSTSTFPRPIFLPINPDNGMEVLNVTGVSVSAAVDFSCSIRLGLWPANIWALCWHIAWTSCKAGVRQRLTGVLRGVASGLATVVLKGVTFSGLAVVDLSGVAQICFAAATLSAVILLSHLTKRTLWGVAVPSKTSSSLHWLWHWRGPCFLSAGSSSDWEPPSLSVESLCWRCKRERRFASARFGVSQFPLEAESSSSRNEPS